jgi:hypothetical protein
MPKKVESPRPERLIEAPIIFADTIPTLSLTAGILDVTLAATLVEIIDGTERKRCVVVADLKMPLPTAAKLHDMLGKIILASTPTAGGKN